MHNRHSPQMISLTLNARNIGILLIAKNVYFIPYGQDNPVAKPNSLVAHMDKSRMSLYWHVQENKFILLML